MHALGFSSPLQRMKAEAGEVTCELGCSTVLSQTRQNTGHPSQQTPRNYLPQDYPIPSRHAHHFCSPGKRTPALRAKTTAFTSWLCWLVILARPLAANPSELAGADEGVEGRGRVEREGSVVDTPAHALKAARHRGQTAAREQKKKK